MRKFYSLLPLVLFLLACPLNSNAARVDSVDIVHYDISATIRNLPAKTIQCETQLTAVAKFNGVQHVTLDLLKLTTTLVKDGPDVLNYLTTDSTLYIVLNKTYNAGDTLRLNIQYNGTPVLDGSWGGFYWSANYAFNMGVGFTHDPHTFGRCLFPCLDNFTDKALYDFHITTDSGYMAVCSGLMQPKTDHPDGSKTWHWSLGQPISTYLAGVAVGKYALVQYNFAGKQRTYPVVLAAEAKDTANMRSSFNRLNYALQCFEEKFGPYMFDRVGFVGVPFNSGAMEHACNISYPIYAIDGTTGNETLFAHELSHHWWGNLVTCATAEDMWLNEGWAAYCEALFLECAYGRNAYDEDIKDKHYTVLRSAHVNDKGYRAVSGVPSNYTYGTHVYKKGALMAHTLRTLMGDSSFFAACRSYMLKYRFKNASSSDMRNEFQLFTPYDLSHFFNSWIFDKGHTDLQLTGSHKISATRVELYIQQVSRWKSVMPDNFPLNIFFHQADGTTRSQKVQLTAANQRDYVVEVDAANFEQAAYVTLNDDKLVMMGKTADTSLVRSTGLRNFGNELLNLTVTAVPDSTLLYIEHHFAGPWQDPKNRLNNVRVSSERYWHIDGIIPNTFKANAFFNYDGSTPATGSAGYLDNELITGTEDSLVLLFRPDASSPFVIHTDNTKQMAGTTDKTGRFWVNQLKKGDYVFGYYDKAAGIGSTHAFERRLEVYPNPADDMITVVINFRHGADMLYIHNAAGKLVLSLKIEEGPVKVSTAGFAKGVYVVSLGDGKLSAKFIVD